MSFVRMTVAEVLGDPELDHLHDLEYGGDIAFVHVDKETGASFEELSSGHFMVTIENMTDIFADKARAIAAIKEWADEQELHDEN